MSNVGLLYVGAVLFLNSLMLLGKVHPKSAAIFNLFIGGLQVITPFYLIFTAQGDLWSIFNDAGIFLFGLTYLYVGITNLKELDGSGVGWYSLWVAIMAVMYSLANFVHFGDVKFGIIWLMWAFLWFLFFVGLGLKRNLDAYTGWVAMIQSWITATIPAFLSLTGNWDSVGDAWTYGVAGVAVLLFIVLFFTLRVTDISKEQLKVGN